MPDIVTIMRLEFKYQRLNVPTHYDRISRENQTKPYLNI